MWGRISSYVGQQDVMPAYITVKDILLFNMHLKHNKPYNINKNAEPPPQNPGVERGSPLSRKIGENILCKTK